MYRIFEANNLKMSFVKQEEILNRIQNQLEGLVINKNWGEVGLFYNPEGLLPKGVYVLTIKDKDGKNDCASNLDREGVFRLNIGISKETFESYFGKRPARPKAGQVIDLPYDFTQKNTILPHPVYGWMSWISILNPDESQFKLLKPFIEESYSLAIQKYELKIKKLK